MEKLLYNLSIFSNIINGVFGHNKNLHNARFAKLNELAEITARGFEDETALLIGRDNFDHVLRVRPTTKRPELWNVLIEAPTRGGKGLLGTSQLLTWKGSVIVNDIKGELYANTAGFRSTLGDLYVIDTTGVGHRYDPLTGKTTEDEFFSSAARLLFKADEGDGAIFTQRATVMLTQLFLAARMEGHDPFPYIRQMIRSGMVAAAQRLEAISPELSTQFLDVEYDQANLSDRFLLSAWGTLSARLRPLLTQTVIRSLAGSDFRPLSSLPGKNR